MQDLKSKYTNLLNAILSDLYDFLNQTGSISRSGTDYIDGFLDAGLQLGIVDADELQAVIMEETAC